MPGMTSLPHFHSVSFLIWYMRWKYITCLIMTVLAVGKEINCMHFDQTYQVSRSERHLSVAQESSIPKLSNCFNCMYFFCFFS